jgi:hypothetical protein
LPDFIRLPELPELPESLRNLTCTNNDWPRQPTPDDHAAGYTLK